MCVIKFMFDYCASTCLWTVNHEAEEAFGLGLIPTENLPISEDLRATIKQMCKEYDTCLNWDNPADVTPWTLQQIESFRSRATSLYNRLVCELGQGIKIENRVDADLDFRAKEKQAQSNGSAF